MKNIQEENNMNITFAPRGRVQIDGARITYKNFRGEGSQFNRAGDRNFAIIIPSREIADALTAEGWNVRIKEARTEEEDDFMYLPVKVKFNERGPICYLRSGKNTIKLSEDTIHKLDEILIENVDLDIRPYDWTVNGKTGRSAYLEAIEVTQKVVDRFAGRYEEDE